jgi:DMSO/TMAO reductase YedYZ molybdopterin-dependent catalytic subunit
LSFARGRTLHEGRDQRLAAGAGASYLSLVTSVDGIMASEDGIVGRVKDKLVASKRKWAADGRLLTGRSGDRKADRLPPGQHLVKNWPVLDLGHQPRLERWDWTLAVDGLVENKLAWTYQDFLAQPQTADTSDIHCVTAWSRFDNRWEGVRASHLLALAKPLPKARHVLLHCYDGYTTNLRLEHFAGADVLLAHKWEGEPISREHGGPVRLVVPKFYFWKSAKWVKRIEFISGDQPGFWERNGYHNEGDPWKEQRYG